MRGGAGRVGAGHGRADARWWASVPPRQVSHLAGVDPELLRLALDPLPPSAPAVLAYRPGRGLALGGLVTAVLDEWEGAARALLPRWLPGAGRLDGGGPLSRAAVRGSAARLAARSAHFGPFLADLAERALRADDPGTPAAVTPAAGRAVRRPRFPAEVRAAGLARVLAEAYGRDALALLVEPPQGAGPEDERVLVAAAEWLVQHGRCAVWLAGPLGHGTDRVRSVPIVLPAHLTELTPAPRRVPDPAGGAGLAYPPVAGAPRPDSAAEQALERALAPHDWARGRRWNHVYEWHPLGRSYRLDVFWSVEGLAVEVDGPEHRGRMMFADDRRRDVQLQLLGLDVLRFTNEQVLADVEAVARSIRDLLARRRAAGAHPAQE
ncbi:DUF559 domain-containing protein [Micromonospora sp. RTGN7]|uniref:DUF559 domain-containing protein n=1 Tax=Micromonospora sp. RTGN7 TaxID=3016526 RepID=UPI0029FEE26A|nr:DUF559 domain-containing protein [Micromonospora sp. RTGN7]